MKTSLFFALFAIAGLSACGDRSATAPPDATATENATATGTVASVDAAGGRIVIEHGPVESLGWPAMTMGFKATAGQVQSVQPGQQIRFTFATSGTESSIIRIEPLQASP